jgi:putative ABC transport system permease protein
MILFLFKGLIRDPSRSLLPLLTVIAGVMLTVVMYSWIQGTETDMISSNANFNTGHVKIMSRAYAEEAALIPNDLALLNVEQLLNTLKDEYPQMVWTPRIRFRGILDIPDENGETKYQGPTAGLAVDFLSSANIETNILNLQKALVRGRLPHSSNEILLGDQFARDLHIEVGQKATLISSTMYGSQTTENFIVTGTIRFGVSAMDRGAIITDITGIQPVLDMSDASGEILGFYSDFIYRDKQLTVLKNDFNNQFSDPEDEFSPVMLSLRDQMGLAQTLKMVDFFSTILISIFVLVMSIVLWNAGLMGSLRRYGEIGVRLAIGEDKGHLYRSMIVESILIGSIGSIIGTAIGIAFAYYLQIHGIDISAMLKNASMLISNVVRAKVTPLSYFIGFLPGLMATILGTSISGIGIYKRQTSELFKEMEG